MTRLAAFLLTLAGLPAAALELELPAGAILAADQASPFASTSLPTGPFGTAGAKTVTVEGAVSRQAWQIPETSLTTLQILVPLRDQLEAAGFMPRFQCKDVQCGGFDFRYGLQLLPEPDMHVNLGDFHYLLASAEAPGTPDLLSLTVSRSGNRAFIHITRIGAPLDTHVANANVAAVEESGTGAAEAPVAPRSLGVRLSEEGHASLDDLEFPSGSAELEPRRFDSLAELADFLGADPEIRVILVGHSDADGPLDRNIDLSRRRAEAARARLIEAHGVAPEQITAEGIGFLAPIAPNDTEKGRARNRRVEVVQIVPD